MVINYQLGKVYKIVGNGFIYVGSTCEKYLSNRLAGHNRVFRRFQNGTSNYVTSFKCLSDENHYIELLELFPCNSKDELHTCERKWIEQLDCVNKCIPLRTDIEKSEYHKQYNQNNRDKINEYHKQYYQDNKDRVIEKQKQYYQDNRDKTKQYQQDNKDKINEQRRNRYHAKRL
jgi:hypothetical protein